MRLILIAAGAALIATSAAADPWKDESGKGREHYSYGNGYAGGYYGYNGYNGGQYIPNGHRPPPGECRVWIPGVPPGQQPPPTSCRRAYAQAHNYGGYVVRSKRNHRGYYGYERCDEKDWRKGEC